MSSASTSAARSLSASLYNPERKKTFFFYNMEWRRLIQGGLNNSRARCLHVRRRFWQHRHQRSDRRLRSRRPFSRQNCPGGVLPAGIVQGSPFPEQHDSCLHDRSQLHVSADCRYFPGADTTGTETTFIGGNNSPTNLKEEVVRIDHNFTSKFSVFGHFIAEQVSQGFAISQWSGANVPTVGDTFGNPSYSAVVHATYAISPNLLNETAFNYNGNRINIVPFRGRRA